MRDLIGFPRKITLVLGCAASIFALYTACFGVYGPFIQRGVHVLFLLPLVFLLYPFNGKHKEENKIPWYDWALAFASLLPPLYVVLNCEKLEQRIMGVSGVTQLELFLGTILLVVIIEAIRRCVAPAMAVLVFLLLMYLPFGRYMPGIFAAPSFSFPQIIEETFLLSGEGVFGLLMGMSATYVVIFVLFGSFVIEVGAGEFFSDFARSIAGASRGGPAKIATLSSCLFGTLTGSAVANVYATGTFTIPLMKKYGFKPKFAGAVEAVASTGGQLMPPVMGSAAFLVAENLSIPYIKVAIYALIPAVLYYFALWMMIDFRCKKEGMGGEPKSELPKLREVMKRGYLFVPVILLFYLLMIGRSPLFSGFVSILVCVALSFVRRDTWMMPKKLLNALMDGAVNTVMVMVALAGAGIIVVSFTKTGFALMLGSVIVSLANGITILGLLVIAVFAIILGMGVPTTAAYVITAAIGAYPLQKFGINPVAAHLFILYFAVISNITPPVAIAAYAGANLAKADPMKTGVEAFVLAIAAYIIPFMFAYNPVLVFQGNTPEIAAAAVSALIGVTLLAGGCQGWFGGPASPVIRLLLIVASATLIKPGLMTDLIGLVLAVVLYVHQRKKNKGVLEGGFVL